MKYVQTKSILNRQAHVNDIFLKWGVEEAYVEMPYSIEDDYVKYFLVMPQPKKWYNVWKEVVQEYEYIDLIATDSPTDERLNNKMIVWKGGRWFV